MKKTLLISCLSFLFCCAGFAQDVIITAVFDGPLSGGLPKGVELYVAADIADLSPLGIGGANNGGGSDSVEFSFPADAVTAGTYLYVSSEDAGFTEFFGFAPDYSTDGNPNAMAINGDDAVELFWNGQVIDVFGDINVDGNGTPWEYLDGWAARKPMTGPDGDVFQLQNWNFSGPDALDGANTNATAVNPVPLKSYTNTGGGDPDVTIILQNLMFTPADVTIESGQIVRFSNVENNVEHNVNGSQSAYPCNPFGFNSGAPDFGPWDFDVTFNAPGHYDYHCDPHLGLGMTGTITVVDPNAPDYPQYAIGLLTTENADGVADSIGTTATISGIVYGQNVRPPGYSFTLIDGSGEGVTVFKDAADCYEVTEGDELVLQGALNQFNGLTQFEPTVAVEVVSQGNPLAAPSLINGPLGEDTESKFIRIEGLGVDSVVQTGTSGWNVFASSGSEQYVIRLDSDVFSNGDQYDGEAINVNGIGGQFDSSEPYTDGYQIAPRYPADIEIVLATTFLPQDAIAVLPNPTTDIVTLDTELLIERVDLFDISGRLLISQTAEMRTIDLSGLQDGVYVVRATAQEGIWTARIIKQ